MSERTLGFIGIVVWLVFRIFGGGGSNVTLEHKGLKFSVADFDSSGAWCSSHSMWYMWRGQDHELSFSDPWPNGKTDLFPAGSELVSTDICLKGADGTLIFPSIRKGRVRFSIPEGIIRDDYQIVSAYNSHSNPCIVIRDSDGTYRSASVRIDSPMSIY